MSHDFSSREARLRAPAGKADGACTRLTRPGSCFSSSSVGKRIYYPRTFHYVNVNLPLLASNGTEHRRGYRGGGGAHPWDGRTRAEGAGSLVLKGRKKGHWCLLNGCSTLRDATFTKMTNQNQTDTNEIATTETKYQTDFYSAEIISIFNQILSRPYSRFRQNTKKIPINLGTEIPNTDLVLAFSWYTKFLVTDWHHYSTLFRHNMAMNILKSCKSVFAYVKNRSFIGGELSRREGVLFHWWPFSSKRNDGLQLFYTDISLR